MRKIINACNSAGFPHGHCFIMHSHGQAHKLAELMAEYAVNIIKI